MKFNIDKKFSLIIAQFIGVLIFIYILINLDYDIISKQLISFRWEWCIAYAISLFFMILLKSLRWKTALDKHGILYPFRKVFAINVIASFWGLITPGKLGELSKILYLQKDNHTLTKSSVTIVLDRLYDILMMVFFGIISLVYFFSFFKSNLNIIYIFIMAITFILGSLLFFKKRFWQVIKKLLIFFLPKEKYNNVVHEWSVFKADFIIIFSTTFFKMLFYSIVAYLFYFIQINIIAIGFNIEVSFIYLGLCSTLAGLISLIPISISGLGTREAVFIFFLSQISISSENAVLISFIDANVFSIIVTGVIAFIVTLFLTKDLKR